MRVKMQKTYPLFATPAAGTGIGRAGLVQSNGKGISESILGVLGNGFIGLMNCIVCVKNKKFSIIGFILTGLSISRIFLIWIITIDGFIKLISPDLYASVIAEYITYLWIIINHSSVWFATSLSIFYFLKIANFSHYTFVWMKGRMSRVLLLLMGPLLISLLLTYPQAVKIVHDYRRKNRNTTWQLNMHASEYFITQISLNLGVIFFFALSLITCFLLVVSLWRHNRQMHLNATGFRDPNTEAHVKAIKVLISFTILFILHFIGIAIEISSFRVPENKQLFLFGLTTTAIYPWGHSFILILGNSKLKQASLKILQQLMHCEIGENLRAT
ncbi:PREDICTED: taste receptor type 2 member 10-like [Galeopterus variegatus]|uniref:Taste receptor type 2 n=1 Tax=Galeopterus variegatus TaxID=482537 RepID=A0ABM0PZD8_GALVR|nr:PREDICTED: taste receptor type 2 member 10-like [Galeopterus variegatus]